MDTAERHQGYSSQGESHIDRAVTSCWSHKIRHTIAARQNVADHVSTGLEQQQQQAATDNAEPAHETASKQPSAIKLDMQAMRGDTDTQKCCMESRRRVGAVHCKRRKAQAEAATAMLIIQITNPSPQSSIVGIGATCWAATTCWETVGQ
jgi:hypothetical protein